MLGFLFFNVLNHPNFDLPVNALSSGAFGTITSTVPPPSSAYGSFQAAAVVGTHHPDSGEINLLVCLKSGISYLSFLGGPSGPFFY
jgi:hypothetical protein